ncbi:MAG TPA: XRE family transcriptional regulator [Anaerolineales bacterium]
MHQDGSEAVSIQVGETIRELRKARGLSLRALARASNLSANALSVLERGLSSPSVSTLYRLAEALEIPISRLFQVEKKRAAIVHCRAAERTRVSIPRGLWEGLGGEVFDGPVEPLVLTLESGSSSGPDVMAHGGHEFIYCLRGRIEYQVDGEGYLLDPGDSLLFRAYRRHRWRNPGPTVAQGLLVLSGFAEGERPGEAHGGGPAATDTAMQGMGSET